jgi:hypothetical protein
MRIQALILYGEYEYEGATALAVYTPFSELEAFGDMLSRMALKEDNFDGYFITKYGIDGTVECLQKWSYRYHAQNSDGYWEKQL